MEVVKLKPATKDYIWGGNKLKSLGKESEHDIIAECWELSFSPFGPSLISSGPYSGQLLKDVATLDDLGTLSKKFKFFPQLIKLIDARDNLSVQVHPNDDYALKNENSFGKTEMWYVIEADKGCGLYIGFNRNISKEELEKLIKEDKLIEAMNFYEVKPGESYFIPSGTVHAIGKGVTILEIQQNSNLTYRLYDYNRVDKFGNKRELHIEKAIKVINFNDYSPLKFDYPLIGKCEYFSVYEYYVANKKFIFNDDTTFCSITFIDGLGTINNIPYKKGDTFFVPANKKANIEGTGKYILSRLE